MLRCAGFRLTARTNTNPMLRQELEGQGQTIGMADYLIAGICVSRSTALLTRNRKHFQRISALAFADL